MTPFDSPISVNFSSAIKPKTYFTNLLQFFERINYFLQLFDITERVKQQ